MAPLPRRLPLLLALLFCAPALLAAQDQAGAPSALDAPLDPDLTQVAIEALIVEVNEDRTEEMGIDYSLSDAGTLLLGAGGGNTGLAIALSNIEIGSIGTLSSNIRALLNEGAARIRTRPLTVALHNTKAEIETVDEIPYQDIEYDKQGRPLLTVSYQEVGIKLQVTPRIRTDFDRERIELDLHKIEVSGVQSFTTVRNVNRPTFVTSDAVTKVILQDGETLVIGGLKSRREVRSETRVPILGSLPLLGWAFTTYRSELKNVDVLFFLTPYILHPGENPQLPPEFEHEQIPKNTFPPAEKNKFEDKEPLDSLPLPRTIGKLDLLPPLPGSKQNP